MNWLAELMPLFILRWYAQRYVERTRISRGDKDVVVMRIRRGVWIADRYANTEIFGEH